MPHLVHRENLLFAGLFLSTVGWVLCSVCTGLVQWRVWHVANSTTITSGIAWIGIWRACFFSHVLVSPNLEIMFCQAFSVTDSFVPREIFVAQGLMLVAIILGAFGKAACVLGFTKIKQEKNNDSRISYWFTTGGTLNIVCSISIVISAAWNLHSVVSNFSISFPSTFYLPSSPQKQEIGVAISLGIVSAIVFFMSGIIFLCCREPLHLHQKTHPIFPENPGLSDTLSVISGNREQSRSFTSLKCSDNTSLHCDGIKNEAFVWDIEEKL